MVEDCPLVYERALQCVWVAILAVGKRIIFVLSNKKIILTKILSVILLIRFQEIMTTK